jgi:TetR/AcrR family fatty acid metabolism transcriptional regulator
MDKEQKRELIVEAARERFRRFGLSKTSMHEIASDAGLSVGTLYLYFKNKDELIVACADRFAEKHKMEAQKIFESELPASEKLQRYVISRYRAVEDTRVGSSFSAEIARAVLKLYPKRFHDDKEWINKNVFHLLNEGLAKGEFNIAEPARDAEIFVQTIYYFLPVAGAEPFFEPKEGQLIRTIEWFLEKWKTPS